MNYISMTWERAGQHRFVGSLATSLNWAQVGAHIEGNANDCNGQIGKLLPHL